jgi:hypothetical protein
MPSLASFTYLDYSIEQSNVGIPGLALTAANFDAQVALIAALAAAIDGVCIGTHSKTRIMASETQLSSVPPVSELAQRENKWLVTYADDTTGKLFRVSLPCADLAGHLVANSDLADLNDAGDVAAFVTAFEAYARDPDTGTHTVTVQSMRFVGRNI